MSVHQSRSESRANLRKKQSASSYTDNICHMHTNKRINKSTLVVCSFVHLRRRAIIGFHKHVVSITHRIGQRSLSESMNLCLYKQTHTSIQILDLWSAGAQAYYYTLSHRPNKTVINSPTPQKMVCRKLCVWHCLCCGSAVWLLGRSNNVRKSEHTGW